VVYLALELGAPGLGVGIGLLLAAPRIAGLLQLAAPAMIARLGDRKLFCVGAFAASAVVLFGVPVAASPNFLPSAKESLAALVVLWCAYHLLEYLGRVALWSWFADLVPVRIRGRFFGIRERWMTTGQALGMVIAGLFTWCWHNQWCPDLPRWIGYAVPATVGAVFMAGSVIPLVRIPGLAADRTTGSATVIHSMLEPFADKRFRRLLLFGCWFSFFNGVTQTAQIIFPYRVLGLTLFVMLALKTGMRIGQRAVSPWMGKMADRVGNKRVMIATLPVVAAGPAFFLLAGVAGWWWLIGAWTVWIAYAGLNVCLPNLMLKLSPGQSNTPHVATYYAVTGFLTAVATLIGGWAFDNFGDYHFCIPLAAKTHSLDFYQYSFLLGWITRTMGVLLLLLVIEQPSENAKR
jgi:MFS family permease